MGSTTSQCLTFAQLESLAQSQPLRRQDALHRHIEACEACRLKLDDIQANLDLFNQYRQLSSEIDLRDFPDKPAQHQPTPDTVPTIAGYDILEEIHRGAQGVVYKAIQRNTKRTVALKVLLHGLYASRRQKRRFEREIDLVAALEHPNIVRLYDSGQTDDRHYFAMQYIDGESLTDHVANHRLSVPDTLRLFAKIAHAVAYAHQRGIIHRDLKPSNIRVDRTGQPHVLDFGLAKPADPVHAPDTLATRTGEFFGTLAYAAPEQITGQPDAVDTRTDVYAIGVILYETLTGHPPYPTSQPVTQLLHNITHAQPQKPSRRSRLLNDELDRLILKCLAKDPTRRYQSADALATDLDRYLAGQPIQAKSDSGWYVIRKSLARHKLAVSFALSLVIVITAALLVSLAFWRQTVHQRNQALAAHHRAEQNLYFNQITLAANALEKNDIAQHKQMLEACPPHLRAWEWFRLHWLSDRSLVTFAGHTDAVYPVSFSPDGNLVASASRDRTVRIWNAHTGQQLHCFREHESFTSSIRFSPDGSKLAAAGGSHRGLRVWDVASGTPLPELDHHCTLAQFSPDGKQIVSAGRQQTGSVTVRLWVVATGHRLHEFRTQEELRDFCVNFTKDGNRIALTNNTNQTASEWDLSTGRRLTTWQKTRLPNRHLLPDGKTHLVRAPDFTIGLHASDRPSRSPVLRGHVGPIHGFDFCPDPARIVTGSEDTTCKVWNPNAPTEARVWNLTSSPRAVAFSPDGKQFVTGGIDNLVRLFSATEVTDPVRILHGHHHSINSVAFSPDGRLVASASSDYAVEIWNAKTGKYLRSLTGHTQGISAAAFLDNRRIVTGSWDASIRIWDTRTGKQLRTFTQTDEVWELAISPDRKSLATGGKDATVYLWDADSGSTLWSQHAHTLEIDALAFSPDSKTLVSGANDGKLILWNVTTGKKIWSADTNDTKIYSAVFTPDGRRIATSTLGKIKIWDADTGQLVYAWTAHPDPAGGFPPIYDLALSPNGQNLLSADGQNVKLWPTTPHQNQPAP